MLPEQVEQLKRQYTDQCVAVDPARPELARFRHMTGQVKTVNMSGQALVQFEGDNNRGWYDIDPEFLKIVEKPPPKPAEKRPAGTKEPMTKVQ